MNTEHHKREIDQIKKHVKMLNITGGIAIGALTLAGFFLAADVMEGTPEAMALNTHPPTTEVIAPVAFNAEEAVESSDKQLKQAESKAAEKKAAIVEKQVPAEKEEKAEILKAMSLEEELQSFEASCSDGAISFHWTTSGGSKYAFEIEKTYDQVNFEVFVRAPQPEKKDGRNVYNVVETATVNDDAFYRLRKVVGIGKYEYSEAVKVKCLAAAEQPAMVDVFPNGTGSFRITINTVKEGSYKVTLTDVNNQELAVEEFHAAAGNNEFTLNSNSIIKGIYTLRVSNDSMIKEKKVVLK